MAGCHGNIAWLVLGDTGMGVIVIHACGSAAEGVLISRCLQAYGT